MKKYAFYVIISVVFTLQVNAQSFMVNGYVPNYRGYDIASAVDYAHLDIAYACFIFANVDGSIDPVDAWSKRSMDTVVAKAHAAGKKAYCVLGQTWGSTILTTMSNDDVARANFVTNAVNYCIDNGYDGLDIDWEGLTSATERAGHEKLMVDLRPALKAEGLGLTLTVGYGDYYCQWFTDRAVDSADYLQMMVYDMTGTWSSSPCGQHASYQHMIDAIAYWSGRGVANSKMILGLPNYGYQFNPSTCGTGSARSYASILTSDPTLKSSANVTSDGNTYFNGQDLIYSKTTYAKQQGLAGVFFWEMTQDTNDKRSNLTAALKAQAGEVLPPLADFTVSNKNPDKNVTITFTNNSSLGTATTYTWDFGPDASPATANGAGPHNVSYSTYGYKTVSLTVDGPGGQDVTSKTNYVNVAIPTYSVTAEQIGFMIYPNPVNDALTVKNHFSQDEFDVELFDQYGTLVYKKINLIGEHVIPTGDLAAGVYFVHITDGHQLGVSKIVKAK
jgi:chitinase